MCVKSKVFDYGQEDAFAHEFVLSRPDLSAFRLLFFRQSPGTIYF